MHKQTNKQTITNSGGGGGSGTEEAEAAKMKRAHQIQGVASYFLHRGGGGLGGGHRRLVPTTTATTIHDEEEGFFSSSPSHFLSSTHHVVSSSSSFHSSSSSSSNSRWFSPPPNNNNKTSSSSSSSMVFYPAGRSSLSPGALSFSAAAAEAASSAVSTDVVYAKEPNHLLPKEVVLYQYEACPFCNKIKAFLDYHDIPYKVVEVNPISKKEIKWSSDYKKVPILMVDGQQMVDSSEIIDKLGSRLHPDKSTDSVAHHDTEEENKWRRWVDNHLVHILSPNIYRNPKEALESFDYITSHGNFSFTERLTVKYAGAAAMYFVSKKLKKRHNITDERAALYEAAELWVNALDGRDFLGGSRPNLGDLAVFGVLRPIRNLSSGRDMVSHTHISEWYTRMEKAVGESSRINS